MAAPVSAPPADPVLIPETETESPPPVEVEEAAAPEVEEAAAPESEAPKYVTPAELEARDRDIFDRARRDAADDIRRENQRRGALEAARLKADTESEALATREAKVALWEAGYTDADPAKVTGIVRSLVKAQKDTVANETLNDIKHGLVMAYAEAAGAQVPDEVPQTDGVLVRSAQLKSYVADIIANAEDRARQRLIDSGEFVQTTKIPAVTRAAQKGENAEAREGQRPYNSPSGEPPGSDELTPDKYASLTPGQQRQLQKDNPRAIDAMYAKYVRVPER